jgi:hypothetical protein
MIISRCNICGPVSHIAVQYRMWPMIISRCLFIVAMLNSEYQTRPHTVPFSSVLAMVKQVMTKKPAVAWVSGGSSSHPRRGKPWMMKKPAAMTKTQQATKRGATRLTTRINIVKRPAADVPYVPVHQQLEVGPRFQVRDSACKASMTCDKLNNMTERQLIISMNKGGQLQRHAHCYHCKKGLLTKLMRKPNGNTFAQRCRNKICQKWTLPHAGHPVLTVGSGSAYVPLKQQARALFCATWNVPQGLVPVLVDGVKRRKVQAIYKAWRGLLSGYVKSKQSQITYGASPGEPLDEIEVDGAVFRKQDAPNHEVQWQEMIGTKRRGDRKSLVLERRSKARSVSARAENGRAVPPPETKEEWRLMRNAHCKGRVLVHADGAPGFAAQHHGSCHDKVRHGTNGGKKKSEYVKTVTHELQDGTVMQAKAGTQSLDGWWAHGKRACNGVKAQDEQHVESHVRAEQWRHWVGAGDRWVEAGKVISWLPSA